MGGKGRHVAVLDHEGATTTVSPGSSTPLASEVARERRIHGERPGHELAAAVREDAAAAINARSAAPRAPRP